MDRESIDTGRDPMWWLVIGGVAALVLSTVGFAPSLPDPIAVQWSTDGPITNQMPVWGYLAIACGVWVVVSSALIALRAPLDWRRLLVILVSGVLLGAHVMILENNLGATSARQAEPFEPASAIAFVLMGTAAVWLAQRALNK